jgi:UDP-N-acetylmuramoyl-L-alanyl-D-glutamate--2,6-diaminopimelate ligase
MGPQSSEMVEAGKVGKNAMVSVKDFTGLASDSREVRPGFLFAALPGSKANGASFVRDAVARGATAVLGLPEIEGAVAAAGVRFIAERNPRAALAHLASRFYDAQPGTIAAVTGTNGKTSVSVFLRQIWNRLGHRAASMGTIGVVAPWGEISLRHTTPDPIETHRLLADLKSGGVEYLALEASSHGLDQHRLDGVDIAAAAFTNITRDHLDYHRDFETYLAVKLRLFSELLREGGVAVVNEEAAHADLFAAAARRRGIDVLSIGRTGCTIAIENVCPEANGQVLMLRHEAREYRVQLPLVGTFQVQNALVSAGLAIGLGDDAAQVFGALAGLQGAPGRLEMVARAASGAPIYVDYAHTPDAVETVLKAIRPHTQGRLHIVFGCGGDRDKGKRPLMGAAAAQFADSVIVTDDNPRSEDPAVVRRETLAGAPGAREIADRAEAIDAAIAGLEKGDVLVIAGKGHEEGQIVQGVTRPFSDRDAAVKASIARGGRSGEAA